MEIDTEKTLHDAVKVAKEEGDVATEVAMHELVRK